MGEAVADLLIEAGRVVCPATGRRVDSGIETDLDILGGTDYQNDRRMETAFTINGLVYLNPRSRAQVYLLIGFGWSGAHVSCDSSACSGPADRHYTYFGGQGGGGLEIRLSRAIALNWRGGF